VTALRSDSPYTSPLARLPDHELLRALHTLIARGCQIEADLLAHLAEVDTRRLYLEEGCSSMFGYCTEVLHFSEATAYHRIQAARTARKYPILLDRVRRGEIHLSGVKLLAPHLTPENHVELLDRARHKSKRAIDELLADRAPKPDAPPRVRRLPEKGLAVAVSVERPLPEPAGTMPDGVTPPPTPPPPSAPPKPLGHARFKIQFTARRDLCEKLREAQALLRHQVPEGDLAEIFEPALTLLIEDAKRKKFAQVSRPAKRVQSSRKPTDRGPASRHIPAEIKRAVAARDRGRCAFVARNGRHCESRDFLEFHHRQPWARSRRHSIEGIELRCRAHNRHAALQDYGAAHMQRCLNSSRTDPRPPTCPGASWVDAVR